MTNRQLYAINKLNVYVKIQGPFILIHFIQNNEVKYVLSIYTHRNRHTSATAGPLYVSPRRNLIESLSVRTGFFPQVVVFSVRFALQSMLLCISCTFSIRHHVCIGAMQLQIAIRNGVVDSIEHSTFKNRS